MWVKMEKCTKMNLYKFILEMIEEGIIEVVVFKGNECQKVANVGKKKYESFEEIVNYIYNHYKRTKCYVIWKIFIGYNGKELWFEVF